ncbi:MAG: single-stranded-DNA-specific exonuclease RecJ [Deltaproteobacteria bacterium]|nr:single-stranded-DNA-specific exonuclease RecJ [Deltaproteobacteria bacterium]
MKTLNWLLTEVDETAVAALASRMGIRSLTARILLSRGHGAPDQISRFLTPRLAELRPPDGMADLDRALQRLIHAIHDKQFVGVFGDYDVDGVTTAAILAVGLRACGATVVPRVASRSGGYGLPPEAVDRFAQDGCRLIVTGDCGTSDFAALARARELGIDVVIIDHHQVPSGERVAHALINPHQPEDRFPFKGLASCGIAFYLMAALRSRLGISTFDPRSLLDLVALGTIADLVPLVDENRILVSAGLRELAARRRPGVRALIELAQLVEPSIAADDVSFRLTPRLNAAGRLGDAQLALDLLLAPDDARAKELAVQLDDVNRERQRIQEQVWTEALAAAANWQHAPAIVVGQQGWHHGVVGIIAARLVDRFAKPVVVVGFDGIVGRGSCRTTGGLNLHETLAACGDHLGRYGGHAAAAGVSLHPDQMDGFRSAFLVEAERRMGARGQPVVLVDGIVDLAEINVSLVEELARLAPFGAGNGEPMLAIPGLTTVETRVVGQKHLQMSLSCDGVRGDAICFNMAEQDPGRGAAVDIIAIADLDTFRGNRRARLRVKHLVRTPARSI